MKKIPYKQYIEPGEKIRFNDDGNIISNHDKVIITDRNIYCFDIETVGSFFKKSEKINVEKASMKDILVHFDVPEIQIKPDRNENIFSRIAKEFDPQVTMEIFLNDNSEYDSIDFYFTDESRNRNFDYAEKIRKLLYEGIINSQIQSQGRSNINLNNSGIPVQKKKSKNNEQPQPEAPKAASTRCIGCHSPLHGIKGQHVKCTYCDTEQVI